MDTASRFEALRERLARQAREVDQGRAKLWKTRYRMLRDAGLSPTEAGIASKWAHARVEQLLTEMGLLSAGHKL